MQTYRPVDVLTGRATGLTEPRRIGCEHDGATRGHAADQGGLRGHSVGPSYPWRVVGIGSGWAVVGPDGVEARGMTCARAHQLARELKLLHPTGHIECCPDGPVNISGSPRGIAERLRGVTLNVSSECGGVTQFRVCSDQRHWEHHSVPLIEVLDTQTGERSRISAVWLAHSQHIRVTVQG